VSDSKVIYKIADGSEKKNENVVWDEYKKILFVTKNIEKYEIAEVLARELTIPKTSDYQRLVDSIELFLSSKEYIQRISKRSTWTIPKEVEDWMIEKEELLNKELPSKIQDYPIISNYKKSDNLNNDSFLEKYYNISVDSTIETHDSNNGFLNEYGPIDKDDEEDSLLDFEIDTKYTLFKHSENRGNLNNNTNIIDSKKKYRLISYVSNNDNYEELDIKQSSERRGYNSKIDDKARKIVCNFEIKAQRVPMEMSELQEGYNIISRNKKTEEIERYIYVKGLIGEWSNYDVALLSSEQMKMAKEKGESFWIYVVEFVEDEENMLIHRINNPFEKITKYAFDHGWRDASEKDSQIDKFMLGSKIEHKIYGYGIIKKVIEKGKLKLLIVDFNGEDKKIPLNLVQMKIVEDN
jgi:hypothetical protein